MPTCSATMTSTLDSVIEFRIFQVEQLLHNVDMGGPLGVFAPAAREFYALKETTSTNGQGFANRLDKVHRGAKAHGVYHYDLKGLADFSLRQKTAALDSDLYEIRVRVYLMVLVIICH